MGSYPRRSRDCGYAAEEEGAAGGEQHKQTDVFIDEQYIKSKNCAILYSAR